MKTDFMDVNEKICHEKNKIDAKQKDLNFFPFTHGEAIEKKRVKAKNSMKKEMIQQYQTFSHRIDEKNDFVNAVSVNGKVPVKYMSQYPLFLKPNKHYPYRRLNDTHVETVMQEALQRYEQQLVNNQQDKQKDALQFKEQLVQNRSYLQDMDRRKRENQALTNFYLQG
jgi:hypothetical protein